MVGVPKSTGCQICRKRKIKCDENWPTCNNCIKNHKCCPGPPARHTFKDLGPRLTSSPSPTADGFGLGGSPPLRNATPERSPHVRPEEPQFSRLTQLNEKWSQNGAVFQKFRIGNRPSDLQTKKSPRGSPRNSNSPPRSTLLRQPSPSQHQELSRALLEAFSTGGIGQRMAAFGPFMLEVPKRIGHNAALDAAVACIIHAHSSMVHKRKATEIANPRLYLNAVQAMQSSLEDPREGRSPNTLCASILLGLVEAMAGPRVGNRYLAHVGGAGRLMEILGPENFQDQFAKEILRFNRGGIIITSIYERKPCFLTRPEWQDIAFNTAGLSFNDSLYNELLKRMAGFPALLRELKDLDNLTIQQPTDFGKFGFTSPELDNFEDNIYGELDKTLDDISFDSTSFNEDFMSTLNIPGDPYGFNTGYSYQNTYEQAKAHLLEKLQSLRAALCTLGGHLNNNLVDGTSAIELPSVEDGSPIRTSFHFTSWRVTVAYNCFWSLVILTNKTIMKLVPDFDPNYYALETECRTVAYEICKTWEDAWASKPIGAFHTGLSFVMAYEWCTPDIQRWILKGMNALLEHQMVDTFQWSDEIIKIMCERLAGDGPDLVFKHTKDA